MWKLVARGLPFEHSPQITELAPDELLVAPSSGPARVSWDGGQSWKTLDGVRGKLCTPHHVVGFYGAWTSDDGWRSFRQTDKPEQNWHGLVESATPNIWGRRGRSLMRFEAGRWKRVKLGLRSLVYGVAEAHGRIIVSAGKDRWAASLDGGQTWTPYTSPTMTWLQPTHDGFLGMVRRDGQKHGPVFHSPDGMSWTHRGEIPFTPATTDTAYAQGDTLLLVARGRAVRSEDGGATWHDEPGFPKVGYYGPHPSCVATGHACLWIVSSDTLWRRNLPL